MHVIGWLLAAMVLCVPVGAHAQRQLSWDRIDVEAHLDAGGRLRVTETQAMVFTGDWNGGQRRFVERPGQRLHFLALSRAIATGWQPLEWGNMVAVDEFTMPNSTAVHWRSRLPNDPPFHRTRLSYRLEFEWSGILQRDGDRITLDHDFLFPDRNGEVRAFGLRLTLDPVWRPQSPLREMYMAEHVPPGEGFVLTVPMRYTGAGVPDTFDVGRRPAIVRTVWGLLGAFGLAIAWLFRNERAAGRFAPVNVEVDEDWLRTNVFVYPAEIIGAVWDGQVGKGEVIALLARLERDGIISTEVADTDAMTLRLNVSRDTLSGYERKLVDALFFEDRVVTSTAAVAEHYRDTGFDPANIIRPDLTAAVAGAFPASMAARSPSYLGFGVFIAGAVALSAAGAETTLINAAIVGFAFLAIFAFAAGGVFRLRPEWGRRAALASLLPAGMTVMGSMAYLWYWAAPAPAAAPTTLVAGLALLTLAIVAVNVDAMRSSPGAIAFRKKLAAARAHFATQLRQPRPALRDEWLPWILALRLGRQVDNWTTVAPAVAGATPVDDRSTSSSSTSSSSTVESSSSSPESATQWGGFSGGRSGGAGGGAGWVDAASAVADGVPPPVSPTDGSSSDQSSGSIRDSSDGSRSRGGSSGGGGGGGW